jgi:hypothetical protein
LKIRPKPRCSRSSKSIGANVFYHCQEAIDLWPTYDDAWQLLAGADEELGYVHMREEGTPPNTMIFYKKRLP